jgi:bifunctional NMN adenylyltransferase/nudix hydrolase
MVVKFPSPQCNTLELGITGNLNMTNTASNNTFNTAVIVGRWQIFHKGHETLLQAALATAARVIVVIGSSFRARDARNPFNWQERSAMIRSTLSPAQIERVTFLPVRDYFDDSLWNAAVALGIKEQTVSQGKICLVGFKKDHTSYYLDNFPQWELQAVEPVFDIDATSLRNVFFEAQDPDARLEVMRPYVSAPVLAYLQAWARLPEFEQQVREHNAVQKYRQRWTASAYLTADAVVWAADHVLLIRRGGDIGHGLWALPGGFVELNETFYAAAVRELAEETGFKTLASTMRAALKASQVFDHPLRSPRGRIVTNAFYFNLGSIKLPEICAADDAMEAKWVPLAALRDMEEMLFEDHARILENFLG